MPDSGSGLGLDDSDSDDDFGPSPARLRALMLTFATKISALTDTIHDGQKMGAASESSSLPRSAQFIPPGPGPGPRSRAAVHHDLDASARLSHA